MTCTILTIRLTPGLCQVTAIDAALEVATVALRGEPNADGHAPSRAVPFARLRQAAE